MRTASEGRNNMSFTVQLILIIMIGICMLAIIPLCYITIRDVIEILREEDPDEESIHIDM